MTSSTRKSLSSGLFRFDVSENANAPRNTHGHGRIEGVPSHATGTSPVLKLWRSESEAGPPGIVEEQDAYRVLVETFRLD